MSDHGIKLPSGRTFAGSAGIIGLRAFPDADYPPGVFEGYDGGLIDDAGRWSWRAGTDGDLTVSAEDRRAIATFMVEQWAAWGGVALNGHAVLDDVGAQSREHAPDGKVGRDLTVGERIRALAAERDRAVDAERLTREAHKRTTAENIDLRARIDAMTKLAAGPIDTEGNPG